jgi:hypothetical protein
MEVLHRLHSLACVRVSAVDACLPHHSCLFPSAPLLFHQFQIQVERSLPSYHHVVCRANHDPRFTYLFFTVIETKGPNGSPLPLEEIAKLFDGDEAEPDLLESVAAQEEAARIAGMDGVEKDKAGSGRGEITQVENTGRG